MIASAQVWALIRHEISVRRQRDSEPGIGRRRWTITIPSFILWFLVITWQGPRIHFNLNYAWYATLALPILAMSVAASHLTYERTHNTVGWWLTLPLPRYQLIVSKWAASLIQTVRRSTYLATIAVLGIYTMILNGTLSFSVLSHFLLTGLTWTILMYCLVPALAALGVLSGVLTFSRFHDLTATMWLLLLVIAWLPISRPGLYLSVSRTLSVSIKPAFILAVLVSWILAGVLLGIASRILARSTRM